MKNVSSCRIDSWSDQLSRINVTKPCFRVSGTIELPYMNSYFVLLLWGRRRWLIVGSLPSSQLSDCDSHCRPAIINWSTDWLADWLMDWLQVVRVLETDWMKVMWSQTWTQNSFFCLWDTGGFFLGSVSASMFSEEVIDYWSALNSVCWPKSVERLNSVLKLQSVISVSLRWRSNSIDQ